MRLGRIGIITLGLLVSFSFIGTAAGQAKGGTSATPAASTSKKKAKAGPSQEHIEKGMARYLARDFPGATAAFQDGVAADPSRAFAYYMLGCGLRAEKKYDDAEATFRNGIQRAMKDPQTRMKLLFVIADMLEEQKKWDEAQAAWRDYADFVAAVPKLNGYPATPTNRIAAIEQRKQAEISGAKVKERIQTREREVGETP